MITYKNLHLPGFIGVAAAVAVAVPKENEDVAGVDEPKPPPKDIFINYNRLFQLLKTLHQQFVFPRINIKSTSAVV